MDDKERLPLSYLSQMCYCPRRAGLLLNERLWAENADTAKGRAEHERVHTERVEKRGKSLKLYEYTVFSDRLGLLGKCDCIEAKYDENGCTVPAVDFPVSLYPVEYKHGRVRDEEEYKLQLCAQAMCLEEMFDTAISEGAIFYISSHRRVTVSFDDELRKKTEETAVKLHEMRRSLTVPQASFEAKCRRCSLNELCMPKVSSTAEKYLNTLRTEATKSMEDEE